jgi:hypothetical protein
MCGVRPRVCGGSGAEGAAAEDVLGAVREAARVAEHERGGMGGAAGAGGPRAAGGQMTREEALDAAVASVCQAPVADFRRGEIEERQLRERIRRRLPAITALVQELLGGARVANCGVCGRAATTRIGGRDYCEAHAAETPRAILR